MTQDPQSQNPQQDGQQFGSHAPQYGVDQPQNGSGQPFDPAQEPDATPQNSAGQESPYGAPVGAVAAGESPQGAKKSSKLPWIIGGICALLLIGAILLGLLGFVLFGLNDGGSEPRGGQQTTQSESPSAPESQSPAESASPSASAEPTEPATSDGQGQPIGTAPAPADAIPLGSPLTLADDEGNSAVYTIRGVQDDVPASDLTYIGEDSVLPEGTKYISVEFEVTVEEGDIMPGLHGVPTVLMPADGGQMETYALAEAQSSDAQAAFSSASAGETVTYALAFVAPDDADPAQGFVNIINTSDFMAENYMALS